MLDLLPWQDPFPYAAARPVTDGLGPADWEPFIDLLPWAAPKKASEWMTPRRSEEFVDEIGPRIIDDRQIFAFDDTLSKPDKEERE